MPPRICNVQLNRSLDHLHRSINKSVPSSDSGSVLLFESIFGSVEPSRLGLYHWAESEVYHNVQLRAYLKWRSEVYMCAYLVVGFKVYLELFSVVCEEYFWEYTVMQGGRLTLSPIGNILECMLKGVHGSVFGCDLGTYSEVYLEVYCKRTWKCEVK